MMMMMMIDEMWYWYLIDAIWYMIFDIWWWRRCWWWRCWWSWWWWSWWCWVIWCDDSNDTMWCGVVRCDVVHVSAKGPTWCIFSKRSASISTRCKCRTQGLAIADLTSRCCGKAPVMILVPGMACHLQSCQLDELQHAATLVAELCFYILCKAMVGHLWSLATTICRYLWLRMTTIDNIW